eukprot:4327608-Prymnesium_polylepis.1
MTTIVPDNVQCPAPKHTFTCAVTVTAIGPNTHMDLWATRSSHCAPRPSARNRPIARRQPPSGTATGCAPPAYPRDRTWLPCSLARQNGLFTDNTRPFRTPTPWPRS